MPSSGLTLRERMDRRVQRQPSGCWTWDGPHVHNGYATASAKLADGRWSKLYVHRLMFEWHKGPIPVGLDLDHLCRNRGCCNPEHLEPVTRGENTRRGELPRLIREKFLREVTHCKHGHPFNDTNTIWRKGGGRACRACSIERGRIYDAKRRQKNAVKKSAKLTGAAVVEIRRELSAGKTIASLMKRFNMSDCAIRAIKYNKTWKHLSEI